LLNISLSDTICVVMVKLWRNEMLKLTYITLLTITAAFAQMQVEKPRSFNVPLAIITTTFDNQKNLIEAFVTYEGLHEGWALSITDDRYVKDTRSERIDHTFREIPTQTPYLSPFEAEIIDGVCESFLKTLNIFEKDLQNKRWGRTLYIDQYFPNFFTGFFYLFGAARASYSVVPAISCIADSLVDSNNQSIKSQKRINYWVAHEEHVVKLRIAAKELQYQIGLWRKIELSNTERDAWKDFSGPCMKSYEMFLELYFNLQK
jgi:hypothetical protein